MRKKYLSFLFLFLCSCSSTSGAQPTPSVSPTPTPTITDTPVPTPTFTPTPGPTPSISELPKPENPEFSSTFTVEHYGATDFDVLNLSSIYTLRIQCTNFDKNAPLYRSYISFLYDSEYLVVEDNITDFKKNPYFKSGYFSVRPLKCCENVSISLIYEERNVYSISFAIRDLSIECVCLAEKEYYDTLYVYDDIRIARSYEEYQKLHISFPVSHAPYDNSCFENYDYIYLCCSFKKITYVSAFVYGDTLYFNFSSHRKSYVEILDTYLLDDYYCHFVFKVDNKVQVNNYKSYQSIIYEEL